MTTKRAQRAEALERWADEVDSGGLVETNTAALRTIAELVEQRDDVDTALLGAIRDVLDAGRSWLEIGAMFGVSKHAAHDHQVGPDTVRARTPVGTLRSGRRGRGVPGPASKQLRAAPHLPTQGGEPSDRNRDQPRLHRIAMTGFESGLTRRAGRAST